MVSYSSDLFKTSSNVELRGAEVADLPSFALLVTAYLVDTNILKTTFLIELDCRRIVSSKH